ncbi:MAG: nucleoside-diphosphate kinase [Candidatus Loosdrechtia sp.]|uniref:nucleoside-diphosphate kinase n=1 Tax=Candidatus Loosdrechtia sp. TaxID=3101272 RepID=UPI003A64C80D|nr:MAG: nucleoside-diphosphate kinase [Candidatus Jettenia sp. AMX2]
MEKTLIILKPDAIQRRLLGKIISRFEEKGFQILGLKMTQIPESLARKHYASHEGKDFFEPLIRYTISAPVILMVLQGKNVIEIVRKMMGATFGSQAELGTIRGDYAVSNRFNLIHGSDSLSSAENEIDIFFCKNELFEYKPTDIQWIYDMSEENAI